MSFPTVSYDMRDAHRRMPGQVIARTRAIERGMGELQLFGEIEGHSENAAPEEENK